MIEIAPTRLAFILTSTLFAQQADRVKNLFVELSQEETADDHVHLYGESRKSLCPDLGYGCKEIWKYQEEHKINHN